MYKKSVILFGSTDFTYGILKYLLKKKIEINGIVTIKESFKISYSQQRIQNIIFKKRNNEFTENYSKCDTRTATTQEFKSEPPDTSAKTNRTWQ